MHEFEFKNFCQAQILVIVSDFKTKLNSKYVLCIKNK